MRTFTAALVGRALTLEGAPRPRGAERMNTLWVVRAGTVHGENAQPAATRSTAESTDLTPDEPHGGE